MIRDTPSERVSFAVMDKHGQPYNNLKKGPGRRSSVKIPRGKQPGISKGPSRSYCGWRPWKERKIKLERLTKDRPYKIVYNMESSPDLILRGMEVGCF